MRYSIITPTICRPSLVRLCSSIDAQTQSDWEHLVVVDLPANLMTADQRRVLESISVGAKRRCFHCDQRHMNYGHTCRHQVWQHARGEYILYIDDDDYIADKDVLRELGSVTEPWAIFPILRHGRVFFNVPPGCRRTGTGMFLHKREIGRWPDSSSYEADGFFVEELRTKYPYAVMNTRPLVIQPKSSFGVSNAESWSGDKIAKLLRLWRECVDLVNRVYRKISQL